MPIPTIPRLTKIPALLTRSLLVRWQGPVVTSAGTHVNRLSYRDQWSEDHLDGHCECSYFFRVHNNDIYSLATHKIPTGSNTLSIVWMVEWLTHWAYNRTGRVRIPGRLLWKKEKNYYFNWECYSFVVSHPSSNLFCGGAAWDLCEVPPH